MPSRGPAFAPGAAAVAGPAQRANALFAAAVTARPRSLALVPAARRRRSPAAAPGAGPACGVRAGAPRWTAVLHHAVAEPSVGALAAHAQAAFAAAALHLATRGDIGPLTNVDIETVGLIGAITGGSLVAGLIIFVLVRF